MDDHNGDIIGKVFKSKNFCPSQSPFAVSKFLLVLKLLTEFVLRAFNKYIDRIDCHKIFQSIAEQKSDS